MVAELPRDALRGASLSRLRRDLASTPDDAAKASRFARQALQHFAGSGDPRYLGYAAGALSPWDGQAAPPTGIHLLRGRLLQAQHRFRDAAEDLERLLQSQPGNVQAMLLAADAWRRGGELQAARRQCVAMQLAGRSDLARLCAADLLLVLGQFEQAVSAANNVIADSAGAMRPAIRSWGYAILGDAAFAAGQMANARQAYESAISTGNAVPLALELSLVDLQIAAADLAAAADRLQRLPAADAVWLRRAIVAQKAGDGELAAMRQSLDERFAPPQSATDRKAELHWREKAMYALDVLGDAATALSLAEQNWQVQKGWEDARLLERAARAAGEGEAAGVIERWRRDAAGNLS